MSLNFTALRAARDSLGTRLNTLLGARVSPADLETEVSKSVPAGAVGQIPFIRTDGTRFSDIDYLLRRGAFTNSAAELAAAKTNIVNNATVFATWYRFSHLGSTEEQPAVPSEVSAWTYDAPTDTLSNSTNSTSHIGVISDRKFDKYELEVRLSSTNSDDDMVGVVLAWYVDPETGREYTLTAARSTGGTGYSWAVYYNINRSDFVSLANKSDQVKWGNGGLGLTTAESGYVANQTVGGWDDFVNGTKVKVVRDGDIIKVTTSDFQAPEVYLPASEITIDLSANPLLEKFRGPRAYGYSAWSQAAAVWKVLSFSDPVNTIYDLALNQVWKYNAGTSTWVIDAAASLANSIGHGRLLFNPVTGKTFYSNEAGVVEVGRGNDNVRNQRYAAVPLNTSGGASVELSGIPSWAKKISLVYSGVSTSGSSNWLVQLGTSASVEVADYASGSMLFSGGSAPAVTSTAGFNINNGQEANVFHGVLELHHLGSNKWAAVGELCSSVVGATANFGGSKTLSGVLTRLRLTTVNGTDLYNEGTVMMIVEG